MGKASVPADVHSKKQRQRSYYVTATISIGRACRGEVKVQRLQEMTIYAIENGRVRLGVDRARVLARALHCHPAVRVFPGWDVEDESAA